MAQKVFKSTEVRLLKGEDAPHQGESFVIISGPKTFTYAGEKRALVEHLHSLGWDRYVALIENVPFAPAPAAPAPEKPAAA